MVAAAAMAAAIVAAGWSGETARAAGTEIVDSRGTFVGLVNGAGNALRQLPDGQWVAFPVEVSGLVVSAALNGSAIINVYYMTPNCTGTPYLDARPLPAQGIVVNPSIGSASATATGGKLYYPSQPFNSVPIFSFWAFGSCNTPTFSTVFAGVAKSVRLGFSPPFSIK